MLKSNQNTLSRLSRVSRASTMIAESRKKCISVWMDWVSPEDTTESAGKRPFQGAQYDRPDILGISKTIFWIAVSIGLSLFLGKLG